MIIEIKYDNDTVRTQSIIDAEKIIAIFLIDSWTSEGIMDAGCEDDLAFNSAHKQAFWMVAEAVNTRTDKNITVMRDNVTVNFRVD